MCRKPGAALFLFDARTLRDQPRFVLLMQAIVPERVGLRGALRERPGLRGASRRVCACVSDGRIAPTSEGEFSTRRAQRLQCADPWPRKLGVQISM